MHILIPGDCVMEKATSMDSRVAIIAINIGIYRVSGGDLSNQICTTPQIYGA